MTLHLLFAAGDVGGARAILPIAQQATSRGDQVSALAHGVFQAEGDEAWRWLDQSAACQIRPDALIYATSVSDPVAFQCALAARAKNIPIIHVLDNWSLYGARLDGVDAAGNQQRLVPEVYAVMDDIALLGAQQDNVPDAILRLTGHPGLAKLDAEKIELGGPDDTGLNILFISEPACQDSGSHDAPDGRGYDEILVSDLFAQTLVTALSNSAENTPIELWIAPHPRENRADVTIRWSILGDQIERLSQRRVKVGIVLPDGVRTALHRASHVVGMSSLLLYEAWLLERPTLSIQPYLRWPQLFVIGQRKGVQLCRNKEDLLQMMQAWIEDRFPIGSGKLSCAVHKEAAQTILNITSELALQNMASDKKDKSR